LCRHRLDARPIGFRGTTGGLRQSRHGRANHHDDNSPVIDPAVEFGILGAHHVDLGISVRRVDHLDGPELLNDDHCEIELELELELELDHDHRGFDHPDDLNPWSNLSLA
jgi:hypothetical protein